MKNCSKKSRVLLNFSSMAIFCLGLLLTTSIAKSADKQVAVSIAVVNVTYLMENAPEAALASKALKEQFTPKELELAQEKDEIERLETVRRLNLTRWSEEETRSADRKIRSLKRERARALEDFREELRFARDAALDGVQKSVFTAIENVRIEQGIDIVIQEYVAASARVDLTPSVMTYLKNKLTQQKIDNTNNKRE